MKNIDVFLYQLESAEGHAFGNQEIQEQNKDGNFIVDVRVSYSIRDFKFSLMVNNFFNTEYSLGPSPLKRQEPLRYRFFYIFNWFKHSNKKCAL